MAASPREPAKLQPFLGLELGSWKPLGTGFPFQAHRDVWCPRADLASGTRTARWVPGGTVIPGPGHEGPAQWQVGRGRRCLSPLLCRRVS